MIYLDPDPAMTFQSSGSSHIFKVYLEIMKKCLIINYFIESSNYLPFSISHKKKFKNIFISFRTYGTVQYYSPESTGLKLEIKFNLFALSLPVLKDPDPKQIIPDPGKSSISGRIGTDSHYW